MGTVGSEGWTAAQVAEETGATLRQGLPGTVFARVTIDGRTQFPAFDPRPAGEGRRASELSEVVRILALGGMIPGDLYVAMPGPYANGHRFVAEAARAGAAGIMVASGFDGPLPDEVCVLEVDDPQVALGRLAHEHRRRWNRTLVAVTGSCGKTTTKDLIAAALSSQGSVLRVPASLNTEVTVPLTILGLRSVHDLAVLELGMKALGQIDGMAAMCEPDVAVVTNAGKAHVGLLGSQDAIAQGKSEIYGRLRPGGTAVAPIADRRLVEAARQRAEHSITFGWTSEADVAITDYEPSSPSSATATLAFKGASVRTTIPAIGRHNAENAACAVAAAVAAGVPFETACASLAKGSVSTHRGEIEQVGGRSVVKDCYNANPVSMRAALGALAERASGRPHLAIIGDMNDLGDTSAHEHHEIGRLAAGHGIRVIAVGDYGEDVVRGARSCGGWARTANDVPVAAEMAWAESERGDYILVKAGVPMRFERVVVALRSLAQLDPTGQRQ